MSGLEHDIPFALCCCGTPLVSTFEVRMKEWYCVTCEQFFEFMHARNGTGTNPSPELDAQYKAAREQYDAEREARRAAKATA